VKVSNMKMPWWAAANVANSCFEPISLGSCPVTIGLVSLVMMRMRGYSRRVVGTRWDVTLPDLFRS